MGDYFQTLVVQDVDLEEAAPLGERIRSILVRDEIVRAERSRDDVLDADVHAPGRAWRRAARSPNGQSPHGLLKNEVAIEVGRRLHGFGGENLVCSACRAHQTPGPAWDEAVAAYEDRGELIVHACSKCGAAAPSIDWTFDWPMALGALAITFWNWPPLKRPFIEALEGELDRRIKLVRGKL